MELSLTVCRWYVALMRFCVSTELMLLGLIAILVFIFNETGASEHISHSMSLRFPLPQKDCDICPDESIIILFEKVHLGISATMGIYFVTCIYLVTLHWLIYRHWIRIDIEPFDMALYESISSAHNNTHPVLRYLHLPRLYRLWRLHGIDRIHALRAAAIEQYNLPKDFQWSKYSKLAMRDVVIHILEVHPICWGILVLALLLTFARVYVSIRVENTDISMSIYGGLSLIIATLSGVIYLLAARIYRKALNLPSIRKHLHTKAGAFADEFDPEPRIDEETSLLTRRSLHSEDLSLNNSDPATKARHDGHEHSFEDVVHGKPLHFKIFKRLGDVIHMMSVDEYREQSRVVGGILRRAQNPTEEDEHHKNMLFFRSRRFLLSALQVVTFCQTWVFGLSVYYIYSAYRDAPQMPPKMPWLVIPFMFVGPLITYGIMGPTLAKLVKATYSGGLIRAELLIEAHFLRKSSAFVASFQYQNPLLFPAVDTPWSRGTMPSSLPLGPTPPRRMPANEPPTNVPLTGASPHSTSLGDDDMVSLSGSTHGSTTDLSEASDTHVPLSRMKGAGPPP